MKRFVSKSGFFYFLLAMVFSELAIAAGPFRIAPQETKYGIPTWGAGRHTKIIVHCKADGRFDMTAGGSATEVNTCRPGRNEYERNFGGVYLAIKNMTAEDITVYTE
jgi:hypothetical protein